MHIYFVVITVLVCGETASVETANITSSYVTYTPLNIPHTRLLSKVRSDLPDPLIRPVYQASKPISINATIYIAQLVDVVCISLGL